MLHVFSTNRVKLWYTHNKSDNLLETQGVDCFKRGLKIITRYTCIINMKRTKFIHKCTYTDLIISRIFGKKKNLPQPIMNRVPSSWLFLSFTYYHRKRWLIVSMAARPGGFDATPLLSWWRAAIVHRLYTDRGPLEFGALCDRTCRTCPGTGLGTTSSFELDVHNPASAQPASR
jgi:hypothetical protein